MTIFEIIALGAVQGLTEFLPVSSSGHLVLARLIFSIPDSSGTAVDAFLHLGTLLAVLAYYRKTWVRMIQSLISRRSTAFTAERELLGKLAIATIPAAVIGYGLQSYADTVLRSPRVVAIGLAVTATLLLVGDMLQRKLVSNQVSWRSSLVIGIAQVLALVPGVSRSGVTIAAGRIEGLSRSQAAEFSFLLSAPIIAGAGLSSLMSLIGERALPFGSLLIGLLVSFLFGFLAISAFIKMVERISLIPFAVYLYVVAVVITMV